MCAELADGSFSWLDMLTQANSAGTASQTPAAGDRWNIGAPATGGGLRFPGTPAETNYDPCLDWERYVVGDWSLNIGAIGNATPTNNLLYECLKDHRRAEAKDAEIAELRKHVAELEAKDKEREARLARLEAPAATRVRTIGAEDGGDPRPLSHENPRRTGSSCRSCSWARAWERSSASHGGGVSELNLAVQRAGPAGKVTA